MRIISPDVVIFAGRFGSRACGWGTTHGKGDDLQSIPPRPPRGPRMASPPLPGAPLLGGSNGIGGPRGRPVPRPPPLGGTPPRGPPLGAPPLGGPLPLPPRTPVAVPIFVSRVLLDGNMLSMMMMLDGESELQ